jgi:hypothetical protein
VTTGGPGSLRSAASAWRKRAAPHDGSLRVRADRAAQRWRDGRTPPPRRPGTRGCAALWPTPLRATPGPRQWSAGSPGLRWSPNAATSSSWWPSPAYARAHSDLAKYGVAFRQCAVSGRARDWDSRHGRPCARTAASLATSQTPATCSSVTRLLRLSWRRGAVFSAALLCSTREDPVKLLCNTRPGWQGLRSDRPPRCPSPTQAVSTLSSRRWRVGKGRRDLPRRPRGREESYQGRLCVTSAFTYPSCPRSPCVLVAFDRPPLSSFC